MNKNLNDFKHWWLARFINLTSQAELERRLQKISNGVNWNTPYLIEDALAILLGEGEKECEDHGKYKGDWCPICGFPISDRMQDAKPDDAWEKWVEEMPELTDEQYWIPIGGLNSLMKSFDFHTYQSAQKAWLKRMPRR